jgi:endonuclease-8
MLRGRGVRRRVLEVVLGPDLLKEPVAYGVIVLRARGLLTGDTPILDVLLDQRVACGIGNVYKSELLFLEGWYPECPLKDLTEDQLLHIYRLASRLLRANAHNGPRVTRQANDHAGKLWVYGRRGQPCLRCDDVIRGAKRGRGLRSTYWCPSCQPAGAA